MSDVTGWLTNVRGWGRRRGLRCVSFIVTDSGFHTMLNMARVNWMMLSMISICQLLKHYYHHHHSHCHLHNRHQTIPLPFSLYSYHCQPHLSTWHVAAHSSFSQLSPSHGVLHWLAVLVCSDVWESLDEDSAPVLHNWQFLNLSRQLLITTTELRLIISRLIIT